MKIKSIKKYHVQAPIKVVDCFVGDGYVKIEHGSLPDVDTDFESEKRYLVKEYMERRYNRNGQQRVFSAGTFTTMKTKAVIKDVARTMRISPQLVNYITAILDNTRPTYADIFLQGHESKKLSKFINDYPQLFEDIRTIMDQPRSSSIHASAFLVTPSTLDGEPMDCYDYVPIKKIDGVLVSENSGVELDAIGLLKNDCLATKELSKLHSMFDLIKEHYGDEVSLEGIVKGAMDDSKTYDLLQKGCTQNVFQFSSKGMTKMLIDMKPTCIEDLIAANALYRPATIENGAVDAYINSKLGHVAPHYFWGTYNTLKETHAQMIYQEQMVQIAREVGNFSLGEGVKLVKLISKKKIEKIKEMKDKFMAGAKEVGCPESEALQVWDMIESGGSYLFNKSHATAYAATSYSGAWLKANYPAVFYTIALQWADDKELTPIMSEMKEYSNCRIVEPDINHSDISFFTDYQTNEIFWSLLRVKMVGASAVDWIVNERNKNGNFSSIENFIDRVFKYKLKVYEYWDDPDDEDEIRRCPVTARHVLNLILAGCFDKVEKISALVERYGIIKRAAERLGFQIKESQFPVQSRDKHYFWSQQQIKVSGLGAIDYERIYYNSPLKVKFKGRASYKSISQTLSDFEDGKKAIVCATIVDVAEKTFTSKKTNDVEMFCKLTLQQNNETTSLVIWPSEYVTARELILGSKDKIILALCLIKYTDYSGTNELQLTKHNLFEIL